MKRTDGWSLEPHCCRVCFGRIASRAGDDDLGARQYVCTNCGAEAVGHKPSAICACGTKIRRGKSVLSDAGLRCHENRVRSPEFPAIIVASFAGAQTDT